MPWRAGTCLSRRISRLTMRTKTFTAFAVTLICLIGMAVTVQLTSGQVAAQPERAFAKRSPDPRPQRRSIMPSSPHICAVFRYVSWASNGVDDKLLQNLPQGDRGRISRACSESSRSSRRGRICRRRRRTDLDALQTNLKQYESTAKDVLDVGTTDPAMATMMLGQTDDKFTSIEGDIRKILTATNGAVGCIVGNLIGRDQNRNYFASDRT